MIPHHEYNNSRNKVTENPVPSWQRTADHQFFTLIFNGFGGVDLELRHAADQPG
jgi:hypothetical protein